MKVLHVVFSCNRIDYLSKSLESWKNLDYGSHDVTRLIIDDYPRNRNYDIFDLYARLHKTLLWMHQENLGLSVTWSQFFEWLKTQDYDYILHQEDDVVLKEPIKLDDMIECLESNEKIASVVLHRQPWYFHESESSIKETDTPFKEYFYEKNDKTFPIIFSLYRRNIIDHPFREYWGFNINEGMVMVYLEFFHKMFSVHLKNAQGQNLIEHIGEFCKGKRLVQGEPNWEQFSHMDPDKIYTSRDGRLVE